MADSEQQCYISFEPQETHMTLIESINTLSGVQDVGQQAPLQESISYLMRLYNEIDEEELVKTLKIASKTRVAVRQGIKVPRSIKVWVRKSEIEIVESIFRNTFNILKIQRPFLVRTLLTAYFLYLREENEKLGVPEEPVSTGIEEDALNKNQDALLRFRTSVEISNMLLKNEEKDKEYIVKIIEIMRQRGR